MRASAEQQGGENEGARASQENGHGDPVNELGQSMNAASR